MKAEMLARESLKIWTGLKGNNHIMVGVSCNLLARILMSRGIRSDETMDLFERSLMHDGLNEINAAAPNSILGGFYYELAVKSRKEQNIQKLVECLHLSKSEYEEAVRIYTKTLGPDDPLTINASSKLSTMCVSVTSYI
jgi:hypothetical protein